MKTEKHLLFNNKETPASAFEIQDGYLLDNNLAYDKKLPSKPAKRTISEIIKD